MLEEFERMMEWGLGEGWKQMRISDSQHLWNERHPELLPMVYTEGPIMGYIVHHIAKYWYGEPDAI